MTNQELADIFDRLGDLLEIKGEVIYKTLAYRRLPRACAPILAKLPCWTARTACRKSPAWAKPSPRKSTSC